ncbi:MAG: TatD family hydrolase [Lachnospiraceae bacterium]|nr:TatD family hydrolase [Lachnospiraceae bacterium]
MIFDSHAHYNDRAFDEDRDALVASLPAAGVGTVVNIANDIESIGQCLDLAARYEHVWCALGIHPSDCGPLADEAVGESTMALLREKLTDPASKAVAVGEIGLDYYWPEPDRELERYWLRRQLDLAREVGLPVVIHSRDAAKDTLDILQEKHAEEIGGVIHCFSYGVEMAREFLKLGFYIGIGGVVTFKNARKLKEVAAEVPADRILLETDCPYLAPVPYRGKRNCSLYLPHVVRTLAEIRGVSEDEILRVTEENARRMYRL